MLAIHLPINLPIMYKNIPLLISSVRVILSFYNYFHNIHTPLLLLCTLLQKILFRFYYFLWKNTHLLTILYIQQLLWLIFLGFKKWIIKLIFIFFRNMWLWIWQRPPNLWLGKSQWLSFAMAIRSRDIVQLAWRTS